MSARPLEGARVVDATTIHAGPFAASPPGRVDRLGATLGEIDVADVIERWHTGSRGSTP